jgi:protein-disulfide isomerase
MPDAAWQLTHGLARGSSMATRYARHSFWLLAATLCLSPACVKRTEIDALKAGQKALADRVAQLERNPTRPGAAAGAPQPGGADRAPGEVQAKPLALPSAPDAEAIYAVPVGDSAVRGPKDAWVTLVMFSDYQCPFCARAEATVQALLKKYPTQLRVVMKHNPLPFHPRAQPAAIAVECAGKQNHFWPVHDALMESHGRLDDQDLEKVVGKKGVKLAAWRQCVAQAEPKDGIVADQQVAATFGARGTPAFFVNGHFINGAQPQPVFEAAIEQALKRAQESGVAAGQYYATKVMGEGRKSL